MNLQSADQEAAAFAVGPRVSLKDIEAAIGAKYEFNAKEAIAALGMPTVEPLRMLSVCVLVMSNGFIVIGKSAPAAPENFNEGLGRKFAYEDCVRQLWPLMGFALREKLNDAKART